jgi:hypothetical protein
MGYDPVVAQRRANHDHLAARLWKRYGLPLSSHDLRMMVGRIRERDPEEVKLVVKQHRDDILLVSWMGKWILLAWNRRHHRIRTFLPLTAEFADDPPEWLDEIRAYRESKKETP